MLTYEQPRLKRNKLKTKRPTKQFRSDPTPVLISTNNTPPEQSRLIMLSLTNEVNPVKKKSLILATLNGRVIGVFHHIGRILGHKVIKRSKADIGQQRTQDSALRGAVSGVHPIVVSMVRSFSQTTLPALVYVCRKLVLDAGHDKIMGSYQNRTSSTQSLILSSGF